MTFDEKRLCELLGFTMSDEQLAAVTADLTEPLLVVAGAGSGKTTVMAARVLWAVAAGGVRPEEILGLTFTSKAAGEFGARVRSLLDRFFGGPAGGPTATGFDHDAAEPSVSTYHAFAHQLVAEHGLRIGIEPGARLLANNETAHLVYRELVNTRRTLTDQSTSMQTVVTAVVSLDQQLAEHAVSPRRLREFDAEVIARIENLGETGKTGKTVAKDREMLAVAQRRQQLSYIVDDVRARKTEQDVIDFADLLRFGHELAHRADVQQIIRERFSLVLLDEYQDTSIVQTELLSSLFGRGHSVTAVGDPLQAIYGWRGASIGAMEEFPGRFGQAEDRPAGICELGISQRSGANILAVANQIAEPLRSDSCHVVTLRPSVNEDGRSRRDGVRISLHETYAQEVEWVADRIAEQVDSGVSCADIAVLCRVARDFAPVQRALNNRGVSAAVSSAEGVLADPLVGEVLSVLAVLDDLAANPAMLSILLGPRLRIGARDLALLGNRAAELAQISRTDFLAPPGVVDLRDPLRGSDPVDLPSLVEALWDPGTDERYAYSAAARSRFAALSRQLEILRGHAGAPLPELVSRVMTTIGLDVEVRLAALAGDSEVIGSPPTSPPTHGLAATHSFMDLVHRYCATEARSSLAGFLSWVRLIEELGGDPDLEVPAVSNSVTLLTVHKAKGLEWDVVAVPFLSEGVFPTSRARPRWTSTVGEIPHLLRGDANRLVDLRDQGTIGHREFADGMKHHAEAEERRLAYVATTRPTRLLLASGHWWGPTQTRERAPSRYLMAAHETLVEHSPDDPWVGSSTYDKNPARESEQTFSWPPDLATASKKRREQAVALASGGLTSGLADMTTAAGSEELSVTEQDLVTDWDSDIELLLAERATGEFPPTSELPTTLTTTELMSAHRDRGAFLASRRRPLPRPPSPAASRGTRFHTWVEERFGQRPLFDELPGAWDEDVFTDTELADLQAGFLETPYANLIPHAIEVPFSIVIGGRVIRGRIDAIYFVDGQWQVVDWKTQLRASADPIQLAIYRAAWAQLAGITEDEIVGIFVYVHRGEITVFDDLPAAGDLLAPV